MEFSIYLKNPKRPLTRNHQPEKITTPTYKTQKNIVLLLNKLPKHNRYIHSAKTSLT
jgi:hypothetical protein